MGPKPNFDLALTPPGESPVWQGKGSIPEGRLATRNLRVDTVKADVALAADQSLAFEPLTLTLYGGTLEGRFALNLTGKDNRYAASGKVERVALGDALAARKDLAGALRGTASGTFDVTGELGDFNSTPRSSPWRILNRAIRDARGLVHGRRRPSTSYSSRMPMWKIDHIFVTPGITVDALFAPSSPLIRTASDHLPLVMDFHLTP